MNINVNELKKEIAFKWVISSVSRNKDKAMAVAYIDARDVMDLLDEIIGSENWQNEFYSQGVNTFCKIGIKINNEWIWKSDTGAISENEPEKSLASDSFKRAAVKWGVGRFLYKIDPVWFNYSDSLKKCLDENGKAIYDLTEHCNNLYKSKNKKSSPKRELPQNIDNKEEQLFIDKDLVQQKINFVKTLPELNNVNTKYLEQIQNFNLSNLVNQKRKELWENAFNEFSTNLEKCETIEDVEDIKKKYKWVIESNNYKDLCAKLINEVSKTVR
jgi:hypothetical protein